MNIAESREEAVAIGQRLVEYGLVDHVNSVFRHAHVSFCSFVHDVDVDVVLVVGLSLPTFAFRATFYPHTHSL